MVRALAATSAVSLLLLAPIPAGLAELGSNRAFGLGWDKLLHITLFAALAWAWGVGIEGSIASRGRALALLAALVTWGGVVELLQGWSGWRSAELADLVADGAGAAAGLALAARRRASATASGDAPRDPSF